MVPWRAAPLSDSSRLLVHTELSGSSNPSFEKNGNCISVGIPPLGKRQSFWSCITETAPFRCPLRREPPAPFSLLLFSPSRLNKARTKNSLRVHEFKVRSYQFILILSCLIAWLREASASPLVCLAGEGFLRLVARGDITDPDSIQTQYPVSPFLISCLQV